VAEERLGGRGRGERVMAALTFDEITAERSRLAGTGLIVLNTTLRRMMPAPNSGKPGLLAAHRYNELAAEHARLRPLGKERR